MRNEQIIKQAYVRSLAARGILRARMIQKRAAGGLKDYAISGGVGAAGGSAIGAIIGALVSYAKKKKALGGAGIGAGIGGLTGLLGGLGYQYAKKDPAISPFARNYINLHLPGTNSYNKDIKSLIAGADPDMLAQAMANYEFGNEIAGLDPTKIKVDDAAKDGLPYGLAKNL